jgi:hypothetical protein
MNVPTYEYGPVVGPDGYFTEPWETLFNQLLLQMQGYLSNNGLVVPEQSTDNINLIAPESQIGTLWYDSTANALKVNINGVVKTVTVS